MNIPAYMGDNNLESGLPGTGKKILGGAIIGIGSIASFFLFGTYAKIGIAVTIVSLVAGGILIGYGMYQNYQDNKTFRKEKRDYYKSNTNINKLASNEKNTGIPAISDANTQRNASPQENMTQGKPINNSKLNTSLKQTDQKEQNNNEI